jgi:hypothetical protein
MALGSTQPLTEMSTRNLPGGKGRPARKADNLTAICESTVYKMWESRRLTTLWSSTACYRDSFVMGCLAGWRASKTKGRDGTGPRHSSGGYLPASHRGGPGSSLGQSMWSGGQSDTGPITVVALSKAWTIFARSNTGVVGSNPTQGIDVCVCVYSVFVLFCV